MAPVLFQFDVARLDDQPSGLFDPVRASRGPLGGFILNGRQAHGMCQRYITGEPGYNVRTVSGNRPFQVLVTHVDAEDVKIGSNQRHDCAISHTASQKCLPKQDYMSMICNVGPEHHRLTALSDLIKALTTPTTAGTVRRVGPYHTHGENSQAKPLT
ncbi:hypothetical protein Bbelb_259110 [Branchiostoma belcheri]|nr:hypothetical protein Bbelb_259110 [Branchiostoma belcheri]